jgi:hypothetical protein
MITAPSFLKKHAFRDPPVLVLRKTHAVNASSRAMPICP